MAPKEVSLRKRMRSTSKGERAAYDKALQRHTRSGEREERRGEGKRHLKRPSLWGPVYTGSRNEGHV